MHESTVNILTIIFWICIGIILYGYAVYPLLLWMLHTVQPIFRKPNMGAASSLPSVTILIAAYNEAACITEKIRNCYAIDYPEHLLQIWVVADGSTDETVALVARFPKVQLFYQTERRGKVAAMQRVIGAITTDCIVFSDANAMLNKNCLLAMADVWQDHSVGAIAGEKRIVNAQHELSGESAYWRYESLIKKWEGSVYAVTGGAGELMAIRKKLFQPIDEQMISDDLLISWKIIAQGYTMKYVAHAFSEETEVMGFRAAFDRRVRVSAGSVQAMLYLMKGGIGGWNVIFWWELISHRLLRTLIIPYCLIGLLPLSFLLVSQSELYVCLLILQGYGWLVAIGCWFFPEVFSRRVWIALPAFFMWVHLGMVWGAIRLLQGRQSVIWKTYPRRNRQGGVENE